jgi:hypothetical protein
MSVFQLQDWWSVKISDTEEFDNGCMALGNIDNANPASGKTPNTCCMMLCSLVSLPACPDNL